MSQLNLPKMGHRLLHAASSVASDYCVIYLCNLSYLISNSAGCILLCVGYLTSFGSTVGTHIDILTSIQVLALSMPSIPASSTKEIDHSLLIDRWQVQVQYRGRHGMIHQHQQAIGSSLHQQRLRCMALLSSATQWMLLLLK